MTRTIASFVLTLIFLLPFTAAADPVVYLVRHGETSGDTSKGGSANPALSDEGEDRAAWIADFLADKGITKIYSTDFLRTQGTIAPLAARLGLQVESYDPRALDEMAAKLKAGDGVILVSGHSNTTPALVNALVGEKRFQPLQHFQFDFVFRVHWEDDGEGRVAIEFSEPRSVYGDHPSEK